MQLLLLQGERWGFRGGGTSGASSNSGLGSSDGFIFSETTAQSVGEGEDPLGMIGHAGEDEPTLMIRTQMARDNSREAETEGGTAEPPTCIAQAPTPPNG